MLSGKAMEAERALYGRDSTMELRDPMGSLIEWPQSVSRWPQEQCVALDGEIDEADDYPSGRGLVAMLAAALLGMVVLATLFLLFYDSSSH